MVEFKIYYTAPTWLRKSFKRVQCSEWVYVSVSHEIPICCMQWLPRRFYGSLSVYSRPLPSEKIAPLQPQWKIAFRRFLLLLYRGCKKHLKIKGTRNYYFKTIGYCSRTKVKSSLILRGFYLTWPWALTLGLKCYYLWELYHAWVLVITLVLQTLRVQPWGLSELTKSGQRLKPFNYTSSYAKVLTFV